MYADLLKHDIAVYAAHTNMDIIWDGLNDWFCELLGIEVESYLVKTHEIHYKLAVYVPVDHAQKMREVLAAAGAGTQGIIPVQVYLDWTRSIYSGSWCTTSDWESREDRTSSRGKVEVILPETIENK